MMATENYGAICIGYSGNAESRRQWIFGWEPQAEELFPDVGHWRLILSYVLLLAEAKRNRGTIFACMYSYYLNTNNI
jgi:hypothetical protein